jgi:3-dehydroquinate synthase
MFINIQSKIRNYQVHIENQAISKIDSLISPKRRYIVISDDGIPSRYFEIINHQIECHHIVFKQGETNKSMTTYLEIIKQLDQLSVSKDDCLIALGGGVVTDLTGFVSSTYLRGIDYVSIPTTLLSQIDASIGGKTGVNHLSNKNMLGHFNPPIKVIIDPQTLNTLSNRQLNNGLAEMIKYGLIESDEIIDILKRNDWIKSIEKLIYLSIMIKKKYIEIDEMDTYKRHILNFGHTLGHAYESYYQYQKYLHGEAISIGMIPMIEDLALRKKTIDLLKSFDLPTDDPVNFDQLIPFINKDKKRRTNHIDIVLLKSQSHAYIKSISIEALKEFIK